VALAGNHIWATIETTETTGSFYRIYLRILQTIGGDDVLIGEDAVEPDDQLQSTFDLHAWLQTLFTNYQFTYRTSGLMFWKTDFLKPYFFDYKEVYYDGSTLVTGDATEESTRYILNGRFTDLYNQNYENQNRSYFDDVVDNKLFLTLQPRTKTIDINQSERLYFLNHDVAVSSLNLNVKVYFSDATDQTINKATLVASQYSVYEIACGFKDFDLSALESTNKLVVKYEVWISAQDSTMISEVFTYKVDRKKYVNVRYLVFRNRAGGYDTVRCFGILTADNEFEHQTGITYAGKIKVNTQAIERFTVNTGLISANYNYYLQELFESIEVWEISGEGVFGITIENKKTEARQGNKFVFNQTVEYTRDLISELFTPDNNPLQLFGDYSYLDYSYDYNI